MNIKIRIISIILFSFIILMTASFIGPYININAIFDYSSQDSYIFWQIRIPRVITAFLTGGILAVSGLVFQSIFKNPIATPYTLGVASGASMGAAIYYLFGSALSYSFIGGSISAVVGALIVIIIVYLIGIMGNKVDTSVILLSGVAISFFCSSTIMFIQYFSDPANSYKITRYMMGSLSSSHIEYLKYIMPVSLISLFIIFSNHMELDIISTGDNIALSRGVNVKKTIYTLYFTVSIMLAVTISIFGPIGFIGMMIPHICRNITSSKNKILIPVSFIFGGSFLIICDTIARIIIAPADLPVGIITSMIGAPFFIFLVIKSKKK